MRSPFLSAISLTLVIGGCTSAPALLSIWQQDGIQPEVNSPPEYYAKSREAPVHNLARSDSLANIFLEATKNDHDRSVIIDKGGAYQPTQIPSICMTNGNETGVPVSYNQGAIIDPPVLKQRALVAVPEQQKNSADFLCAAFYYSVDKRGRVVGIESLYDIYSDHAGKQFVKNARQALSDWRYQPGMVDKGHTAFTGLTTVFYHAY